MRVIVSYAASVIAGAALAILAASYGTRDNVYGMFAVLLIHGGTIACLAPQDGGTLVELQFVGAE